MCHLQSLTHASIQCLKQGSYHRRQSSGLSKMKNYPGKLRKQHLIFCLFLPLLTIPHLLHGTTIETEHVDNRSTLFCNSSLAECRVYHTEELLIDPWSSKSGAGGPRTISYGSLKQDRAVCGARGAYSSNCIPRKSNDYTRPCSKIYRCKS